MNPVTPAERAAGTILSSRTMLAILDEDADLFREIVNGQPTRDLIDALAATALGLAIESYGSPEAARTMFARMALVAEVDAVMDQAEGEGS